jgi:endonuclease/exonuclease/phosphatase family metal-dependent hydrolase
MKSTKPWRYYELIPELRDYKFINDIPDIFGHGHTDRIVYKFINCVGKIVHFDGVISYDSSSYFSYAGYYHTEIVMFNLDKVKRNKSDKYDWVSWGHMLDVKIPDNFKFNPSFRTKNTDLQIVKFYNNMEPETKLDVVGNTDTMNIASINVHFFEGINSIYTVNDNIRFALDLFDKYKLVCLCMQEVPSSSNRTLDEEIKRRGLFRSQLHTSSNTRYNDILYNVTISRIPFKSTDVILTDKPKMRHMVLSTINDVKIGNVHLSLIKRGRIGFTNDDTSRATIDAHMKEIKNIFKHDPDVVIGDFNFVKTDPEYELMLRQGYHESSEGQPATTPFGTTVDFCFSKQPSRTISLNYKYSDHRGIFAMIKKH